MIHTKPVGAKTSFAIFHESAPIGKTKTRTIENQKSVFSSNHDPVSYAEYNTSEDDFAKELEGSNEIIKVRRQISDYWEFDSENKVVVSDSKVNSNQISPHQQAITPNELSSNLSQSYYKHFLNQLKDEDNDAKLNALHNLIKWENQMKANKNSFIKVEEFRKSKQFRESKIPKNTSFSGVDKNQFQNSGI